MKKISELINSPITWKQSIIAAIIGTMLSLIVIAAEFVSWNKMTSKSFKKAKHKLLSTFSGLESKKILGSFLFFREACNRYYEKPSGFG